MKIAGHYLIFFVYFFSFLHDTKKEKSAGKLIVRLKHKIHRSSEISDLCSRLKVLPGSPDWQGQETKPLSVVWKFQRFSTT